MVCKVPVSEIASINTHQYSKVDSWSIIQYLDTGNVTKGVLGEIQLFDPTRDKVPSRCRRKVKDGSIIYSMVRPNQEHYAILSDPPNNLLVSTGFSVIDSNRSIVEPRYLYYVLTSPSVIDHFHALAEQSVSTYPTLSNEDLSSFEVELLPLEIQRQIVLVLESIDKKIYLNSHINDYLSDLMQCLFTELFSYEHPKEGSIYDIADVVYGAAFKSSLFNDHGEGYPLIRIRDLTTYEPQFFTAEEHPRRTFIEPGDVVAGMDAEFAPTFWLGERAVLNQRVCCFRPPKNSEISPSYLLLALKPLLAYIQNYASGTTVAHLGKSDLEALSVPLPRTKDLQKFASQAEPMRKQIVINSIENRHLALLRDGLLPKLLSGKLDVSNIENNPIDS